MEDSAVIRPCGLILDKLHVQLKDIHWHFAQHIEGGISASEIIHLNDKAQFPQITHCLDYLLRVFGVRAFRYLQVKP